MLIESKQFIPDKNIIQLTGMQRNQNQEQENKGHPEENTNKLEKVEIILVGDDVTLGGTNTMCEGHNINDTTLVFDSLPQ